MNPARNFTLKFIIVSLLLVCGGAFLGSTARGQSGEKELFLVAQKAFDDGFYDVAIRYINQLLKEFPRTEKKIQSQLLLGQCYFFKSQYLKAYDVFQALLAYTEYRDATLFWLGETYLKGSDYRQAEKHYSQLTDLFPNSIYTPQAYYSLGWVYFEQNEFDKAQEAFAKLLSDFPSHELNEDAAFKLGESQYYLKEYEKTIQYFETYLTQFPNSTRFAEVYFYIAESYYYLEDPLTAVTYYAKSAEVAYDHQLILMAKVSLGWSYLKMEKYQLSEKHFEQALQFSQEKGILSDDIFLGFANLYSETDEPDKALQYYSELVNNFPHSKRITEAYLGKANTHYLLKNYTEAIKTYQTLIDNYADQALDSEIIEKAYFGLAWSYLKAGDIDASIKNFTTIQDRSDNTIVKISALTQIGDAYQDINELDKAIEIYDQILQDYPDSLYIDYVQYRQGIALLKNNEIEAATLSFQSLQANFPESKYLNDIKYYLALSHFKKGDWKTAKEQIEEFIASLPPSHEFLSEAHYILGLSEFNLRQYGKALKIFQKIAKSYSEQTSILKNSEINIAKCLYKLGNIKESLKKFNEIIDRYPQTQITQESLLWLGDHYLQSSDFENAATYYLQFIENFPGSDKLPSAYFQLGQAYQGQSRYNDAVNILKKIDDTTDPTLYAKARLAIAEIFSKEFDQESAIQTYEKILSTSPEFSRDALVKIADVHKKEDDHLKAIEAYQKALASDKGRSRIKNAELQFAIGDTFELLNKKDRAVETYFKIPYLYAKETAWIVKAYLRIARIFEDQEKWEKARTIYKKIIDLRTDERKFAEERLDWIRDNIIEIK